MTIIERWKARLAPVLAAAALAALAGCGGGGSGGGAGTESGNSGGNSGGSNGGGTPAAVQLVALGSSARTASLAWKSVAGATGYTIERKTGTAAFAPVATLAADAEGYVDDGLAAETAYTYRVVPAGTGSASAEQVATTSTDAPVTTAAPATLGAATTASADAAGISLSSADGHARLVLPAGAVPVGTGVSLQPIDNPVPGGIGNGTRVQVAATPSQPATLTLGYDAAADRDADGLGIAMRRTDGSWLALPVVAIDKTARTLSARLPASLVGTPTGAGLAQPLSVRAAAASVSLNVEVVAYLNFYLAPSSSVVKTGGTQLLVPYARTRVVIGNLCIPDEDLGCLPMPLVDTREIVFENQKTGYTRTWYVEAIEGGSASLGTITPRSGTGAVYKAPNRVPSQNPLRVQFVSRNDKTNRTVGLSATIEVREPVWTGTVHGTLEAHDDLGFGFSAEAVWAPANDDATLYRATGTQSVHVINYTCSGTASPGTVALPPGALTIDRSVEPARYTLDIGSLWDTTITGTCPGHGSGSVGMTVPGRLQVEGVLSGDGTKIEGTISVNGISSGWAFTSQP